jgi:DNA replication protein DnaC
MLQHLNGGRADGSWDRRLGNYLRPDLLILDDFGLKPIQPPGPEDLYDVINERYERSSILLTSNRAPNEWPDLFLESNQTGCHTIRWVHPASYCH